MGEQRGFGFVFYVKGRREGSFVFYHHVTKQYIVRHGARFANFYFVFTLIFARGVNGSSVTFFYFRCVARGVDVVVGVYVLSGQCSRG